MHKFEIIASCVRIVANLWYFKSSDFKFHRTLPPLHSFSNWALCSYIHFLIVDKVTAEGNESIVMNQIVMIRENPGVMHISVLHSSII